MSYLTLLFLFGSVLASTSAEETTTTTTTEAPTPPPQDVVFNLMRSDDDEIKTMDGEMPGVSNGTSNRIIGGKFARANQLPFMVFIGSRFCAGIILNSRWILTTAHCVEGIWSSYQVCAGGLTHGGSGCQSVWPHTDVFVHPGFHWFNVGAFDIAMIRLRQPLHFSASIQPAFLYVSQLPAGINLLTAGWGVQDQSHLEQSYFPTYLKKAVVRVNGNLDACGITLRNVDPDSIYCTGNADGVNSRHCFGDSGGPLAAPWGRYWVVAGLVDFSSADCSRLHGYVNIGFHKRWILHVANNN